MKKLIPIVFFIAFCFQLLLAEVEYRVFESADGATIEATIVDATAVTVTIKRRDGREFKNVPIERFSVADRKYVREWRDAQREAVSNADITAESRIQVSVLKGQDDDKNNYGDIDDRIVGFSPGIVADSDEKDLTFKNVKGTLVFVGRGVIEDDAHVILSRQEVTLDFIPREQTRWQGKRFQCRYDPDFGGFEYAGYLLVLRNKSGKVVFVKGSKSSWEQNFNGLLNAKNRHGYDRNFRKGIQLFNTWGLPEEL